MSRFKELEKDKITGLYLGDADICRNLGKEEKVYAIEGKRTELKNDPLLDVEIALRRCERVGVFKH